MKYIVIILIIAAAVGVSYLTFEGVEIIAKSLPIYYSLTFVLVGAGLYFSGKRLLKKNEKIYKRVSSNHIELSTPLLTDLVYVIGVVILITGVLTFRPLIVFLSDMKWFFGFFFLGLLLLVFLMYKRLRYALNDKIVVTSDSLFFDDPLSNKNHTIPLKDIASIEFLKTYNLMQEGYNEKEYSYSLRVLFKHQEANEIKELMMEPELMNLSYEIVIQALEELSYPIQYRAKKSNSDGFWDGHSLQ